MSKKVILFLVEGGSEIVALELALESIFNTNSTVMYLTEGDISSDSRVSPSNIKVTLNDKITKALEHKRLKKSDVIKVIHIIDTDGAFVDDRYIQQNTSDEFIYNTSCIACKDVNQIKNRNLHKQKNLNILIKLNEISGIPYEAYYLSIDLEHVFHNTLNASKEEKISLSEKLEDTFCENPSLLISTLKNHKVDGDHTQTWEYLKIDNNSLSRCTNLHLIF